ncbi:SPOR domain-containing protein [Pararhodobacter oceanensis]|uniref:SPOR domain-containing protein n=1 Tax=Pararhodobacter oceanensis TaxID=2172121 RepID=UPI003A90D45D
MAQSYYEAYHAPQQSGHSYGYAPQPGYAQGGGAGAGYGAGYPHNAGPGGYPQPQPPRRVGRLVNLVGAALSIALIGGVGIWSYRLMVRDVAGVPVIRALAGPLRISPEDPGGRQAAYQGLAVNNVAAEGGAAEAARTIALAPPPLELSEEDRAVAALVAEQQQPISAPPAVRAEDTAPRAQEPAVSPVAPAPSAATQLAVISADRPGVSRSPVPRARPGGRIQFAAAALPQATTPTPSGAGAAAGGTDAQAEALLQELVTRLGPAQAVDIDPETLPAGTRLVQLGAYDSDAEARAAWDTLTTRFPAYLEGRGRIVEAASAGGRTFFRLRAHGFTDEPEARRFCSVFLAENADCIPVLIR